MAREINQIIIQTIVFLSKSFGRPIQTTCCFCSLPSKSAATLLPIGKDFAYSLVSCICPMHSKLAATRINRTRKKIWQVASVRCTISLRYGNRLRYPNRSKHFFKFSQRQFPAPPLFTPRTNIDHVKEDKKENLR